MPIIKINHLEKNRVKKIFVFKGRLNINDSWLDENNESIFNEDELSKIKSDKIKVVLINEYIHNDDTISTIKKKIAKFTDLRISTYEMYLFSIKNEKLNPSVIYNQLTQDESIDLTKDRIFQYLLNITSDIVEDNDFDLFKENKDIIDYDDFLSLKQINWANNVDITIPLGQKITIKKTYPFTVNPYNCLIMDEIIISKIRNILTTQNSNLLFEYGNIKNNNIFICLAEDVLEYAADVSNLTDANFLNLYFPQLTIQKNINSISELKNKKIELFDETSRQLNEKFDLYNKRIDLLYDIYYKKNLNLPYENNTPGILKLEFTIHPTYKMQLPLEILFKLIHSDKTIPLIKYNPGRERDNIYRLFTNNKYATNGKNIPYLYTKNKNKKGKIIKISKIIARRKRIGFYIEYEINEKLFIVSCEFEQNGNVNISFHHNNAVDTKIIEDIIKKTVNEKILKNVKSFLEQSGYTFALFSGFDDRNIEFKTITFISTVKIKKKIQLGNYSNCLSSAFTILNTQITKEKNEIVMNYKRVSNYNEMDSIESFITEKRKDDEEPEKVVMALVNNFNLSIEEAQEKFAKWASEINVETGLFENKKITIRTNTGFPVKITQDKTNFLTSVTINSINNIGYLPYVKIYIDTMMRMIYDIKTTNVNIDDIDNICVDKEIADEVTEEDVKQTEIKFVSDEKKGEFMDLFGVEENEEEDDGEEFDFGDVEFGNIDDANTSVVDNKEDDGEEFDFGDVEFGNMDIDDSPEKDDTMAKIPEKESTSVKTPEENTAVKTPEKDDNIEVDLTGMRIEGNNNIFMQRREKLQPKLFLKKKTGRYKAYSKACPSEYAKQPIILTSKEKEYIDEKDIEHGTKSYDEHITYGTGDEKYHYICPRFWCLYDENGKSRSISLKEINDGKCGGWDALIPEGSDKVPEGKRIVQFTDKRFHKKGVNTKNLLVYKPFFPSFMGKDKHPDGLCIPCCYGKPSSLGKGDWIIKTDKKGKIIYENTKTGEVSKKAPEIFYDDMYEPIGDGNNGPGPKYDIDDDGNIIMDSIQGIKMQREKPAPSRIAVYKTCNQKVKDDEINEEEIIEESKDNKISKIKVDEAPLLETYPHNHDQLGYLPLAVQKFMGYNCKTKCQISPNDTKLKLEKACILQKGVQKSDTQSFIACIADAFNQIESGATTTTVLKSIPDLSIKEIKKIISDRLNFDIFVTLQNGNLIDIFGDDKKTNVSVYSEFKFYKALIKTMDNKNVELYLNKAVRAYENFIEYINDENVVIDHEYLWDFLSLKRTNDNLGGMFKSGLNLVILNSPDDDITNKLELICPTNVYTSNLYDENKPILILYSRDGYYEPIYSVTKLDKKNYNIQKLFNKNDIDREIPELYIILQTIWDGVTKKCLPLFSMPNTYNKEKGFKNNISVDSIMRYLNRYNSEYKFKTQLVNNNTKVIGLLLERSAGDTIYVPCFPSAIKQNLPYEFVARNDLMSSVSETIKKLKYVNTITNKKIPCNPYIKIVNNNVIVGILTETNQLVPTIPEPFLGDELDNIKSITYENIESGLNFINIDSESLAKESVDTERVLKVKKIKLETHFYNAFRNLVRSVISNYEYKNKKEEIQNIVFKISEKYNDKLKQIGEKLEKLMGKFIDFVEFDMDTIKKITNLEQCISLKKDSCEKNEYCVLSKDDGDVCKMLFPKKNLINNQNNSEQYFIKLADEIIKFERMRSFLFNKRSFLTFQDISYKMNDNEIILLEDLLYGNYFDNLIPEKENRYIKNKITWETSKPIKSIPYNDVFKLDEIVNVEKTNPCIMTDSQRKKLTFGSWKENGFDKYQLIEFKESINCSWVLFKEILDSHLIGQHVTIGNIVNSLIEIYLKIMKTNKDQLLKIMKMQKKVTQSESIEMGLPIEDVITTTNYYLTAMDFFFLSRKYNVPVILLSRTKLVTSESKFMSFINDNKDICYIIYCGPSYNSDSSKSPNYALVSRDDTIKLAAVEMKGTYNEITTNNFVNENQYILQTMENIKNQKRIRIKIKKKPKIKI